MSGIYIKDVSIHDTNFENVDPLRSPNKCTGEKVDVECQCINTLVDVSKSTFREAIEKQHYRVNECWVNCLCDRYRDTLLSTGKTRNVVSRAMILDIVGRAQENIQEGTGILSMEPFFVKYRTQARV